MEKSIKIRKVVDYLRYSKQIDSQQMLAEKLGVNRSTLSSAINGNDRYMDTVIKKLIRCFPEINPDYLLGDSEVMLKVEAGKKSAQNCDDKAVVPMEIASVDELPIVPVDTFRAADTDVYDYITREYDQVNKLRITKVIEKTNLVVMTSNESMMPAISPTDYLLVHKLSEGATLTDGEVYYIDTRTQGGLVRRFTYDRENDRYIGRAENYAAFPDAVVNKEDVVEISAILCLMRFVMPSTKLCDHGDQLRENNAHIASLIEQLDKAGERVDRAGERTDKLLELLFNKMQ